MSGELIELDQSQDLSFERYVFLPTIFVIRLEVLALEAERNTNTEIAQIIFIIP